MESDGDGRYIFIGWDLSYLEEQGAQISAGRALQTEEHVRIRPADGSVLGIFEEE